MNNKTKWLLFPMIVLFAVIFASCNAPGLIPSVNNNGGEGSNNTSFDCQSTISPWDISWIPQDHNSVISDINSLLRGKGLDNYGEAILNYSLEYEVNPAFALSMFRKEADFASLGSAATNNNPGNIRPTGECKNSSTGSSCNGLYGEISTRNGFGVYPNMDAGIKAYFMLLANLYRGSFNCQDLPCIISKYAPSSENNTNLYINQVEGWTKDYQCALVPNSSMIISAPQSGSSASVSGQVISNLDQGEWIAYIGQDENVWVKDIISGDQIQITSDATINEMDLSKSTNYSYSTNEMKWSPNGKYLSFVKTKYVKNSTENFSQIQTLMLFNFEDKTSRELFSEGSINGCDWLFDSSAIIYGSSINWNYSSGPLILQPINGIYKFDINNGANSEFIPAKNGMPLANPRFSPDGKYVSFEEIFYLEGSGYFSIYDIKNNNFVQVDKNAENRTGNYDWLPDSKSIVYDKTVYAPEQVSSLYISDPLRNSEKQLISPGSISYASNPKASPDGALILFKGGGSDTEGYVWLVGADGSNARQFSKELVGTANWTPTGDIEFSTQCSIYIYDLQNNLINTLSSCYLPAWRSEEIKK